LSFLGELRRRNVLRVALAYLALQPAPLAPLHIPVLVQRILENPLQIVPGAAKAPGWLTYAFDAGRRLIGFTLEVYRFFTRIHAIFSLTVYGRIARFA
jgi:hypothetical protein